MNTEGRILSCTKDLTTGRYVITISVPDEPVALTEKVNVHISPIEKNRSLAANKLFWSLINKLAKALNEDSKYVYRQILKQYGEFECVHINRDHPEALSALMKEWRDFEIIGTRRESKEEYFEILCYYGSSKLDAKGFTRLIDGVKAELKNIGVEA